MIQVGSRLTKKEEYLLMNVDYKQLIFIGTISWIEYEGILKASNKRFELPFLLKNKRKKSKRYDMIVFLICLYKYLVKSYKRNMRNRETLIGLSWNL